LNQLPSSLCIDRDFVLHALQELVAANSVNPAVGNGPGEMAVSNMLFDRLSSIPRLEVRRQHVTDDRWNVMAILRGSGGGRSLMLNGHMDTVGVQGMTIEPFTPFVKKGLLHGRGACDMKGAIAAMLGAARSLAESESRLRGDVIFTFVVDEEHMSLGMRQLLKEHEADAAIVGEPTDMNIATAHKGFLWIEVEIKGRAAHGSVPEKGIDSIVHAAEIVSRLKELQDRLGRRTHPLVGTPKIHTSTIEGGTHWSIVPDRCVLRLERRTIPGEKAAPVMREVQQLLRRIKQQDRTLNAKARKVFECPPLETAQTAPIVQKLRQVVREVTKKNAQIVGVPYWTDGALLAHSASIPTCIFGPGNIGVAHSPDEYVNVKDVLRAAEIYGRISQRFCA
jgi:acetylornithine deacetylase